MVEASHTAAAGTTTDRTPASKPHSAYGAGKRSLGRPANPRRVAEADSFVSERTVSRYLPARRTTRSHTGRTFFANHVGNLAFTSTMMSSFATSHDDVDASVWPCRPVLPSRGRYVCTPWAVVDWPASHQPASLGRCFAQNHLCRGTRTRFKSARTRRGREPSKLVLAVLHPGLLSAKELRSDSSAAHTGILLRHRQGLDHSVSNSRERADSSLVRWS